ncbi:phosphotransferase [uncultured Jatrophihabitans sp.]|uniref:phosphotransferase n=1 Tax=uncultured Jatrophihabitans sp. TaxID=1610747 RepID=UPI0035C9C29E
MTAAAHTALRSYDLGGYRLVRLAESFNTVFRVRCAQATLVLRVGPGRRVHPADAVRVEAGWTAQLAERGLRVPQLVPAADGAPSVHIGSRECSLWTWVPGDRWTGPSPPRSCSSSRC